MGGGNGGLITFCVSARCSFLYGSRGSGGGRRCTTRRGPPRGGSAPAPDRSPRCGGCHARARMRRSATSMGATAGTVRIRRGRRVPRAMHPAALTAEISGSSVQTRRREAGRPRRRRRARAEPGRQWFEIDSATGRPAAVDRVYGATSPWQMTSRRTGSGSAYCHGMSCSRHQHHRCVVVSRQQHAAER